jgi:hypothetical protein
MLLFLGTALGGERNRNNEEGKQSREQTWLFSLLSSARLGRRFAPLNDLFPFDVRIEETVGVIIVRVPIACPPSAVRAGIFDHATQPLRLQVGNYRSITISSSKVHSHHDEYI